MIGIEIVFSLINIKNERKNQRQKKSYSMEVECLVLRNLTASNPSVVPQWNLFYLG